MRMRKGGKEETKKRSPERMEKTERRGTNGAERKWNGTEGTKESEGKNRTEGKTKRKETERNERSRTEQNGSGTERKALKSRKERIERKELKANVRNGKTGGERRDVNDGRYDMFAFVLHSFILPSFLPSFVHLPC